MMGMVKRMRIGICDDDIKIIEELEKQLVYVNENCGEKKELVIEKFNSSILLLEYIENSGEKLDLIFMDIVYGRDNGIEIGEKVLEKQKNVKIIFITGYINYVEDIFNIVPFAILIKPFTKDRVMWVWKKILLAMKDNKEEFITIKTKEGFYTIDTNKIISIESRGRYLRINTEDVGELNVIMTMNEIEDKVNEKLVRCHRSYFVNIEKIRKIAKYEVTLVNKEVVPVSRPNYKMIYDEYMKYLTR